MLNEIPPSKSCCTEFFSRNDMLYYLWERAEAKDMGHFAPCLWPLPFQLPIT
jgi:hypothetical protein